RVRWPEPGTIDRGLRAELAAPMLRGIALAPAPVMFPSDAGWRPERLDSAKLHRGEHWFALELHRAELSLNLSASTLTRVHPQLRGETLADARALAGREVVRGRPASITQNEGIWSASWIEHGVAYSLELECGSPLGQCVDDRELRRVAESLAYVGGREE